PLAMDKSGRMAQTFDTRSAAHVEPLLDAVEQVLAALDEAGIDAFLAYGSLLGAVREGHLIGHDSDADLGYVSRHRDPVDVARESFELQRRLTAMGYPIHRYSGAAFRIDVREGDGSVRGLDLFGGFLDEGTLFLMGEVGHPFREEWVRPLGRATLEGRSFPVPAEPERLLEAMYGPSWRVPDPAYVFSTPVAVQRALNGWFRGVRVHRQEYGAWYAAHRTDPVDVGPSALAAHLLEQETRDGAAPPRVLDLGAGRATDSLWLARQGLSVTAYDYLPSAAEPARERAAAEGLDLEVVTVNLLDLRSTLSAGALESRRPGPTAVLARHVADCTTAFGRASLWRLAEMALRGGGGGRLYVEHWVDGGRPWFVGQRRLRTERLVEELEARGARVVQVEERREGGGADSSEDSAGAAGETGRTIGRLVAQWQE
ncbi:MAG: Methyltransferase type 11, partial [Marmoricola sp.]|nr:Methyltransferase type 11 [Marmoricola sp.]